MSIALSVVRPLRSVAHRRWGTALTVAAVGAAVLVAPTVAGARPVARNELIGWGSDQTGAEAPPAGLTGVKAVSAGFTGYLASRTDGTVVGWGQDGSSQDAVPAGLTGIKTVAAGYNSSFAVKTNGTVVGWGSDQFGTLDIPAGLTGVKAVDANIYYALALKSDGTVVGWGSNPSGQLDIPAGLTGVTALATGQNHALALKSDGTVVGWGVDDGRADPPAGLDHVVAISSRGTFSMALRSDGTVVQWGPTDVPPSNPVPAGLSGVVAVSMGLGTAAALKSDGTVVAWVVDTYPQGDRTAPATLPAGLSHVTAIAIGGSTGIALTTQPLPTITDLPTSAVYGDTSTPTTNASGGDTGSIDSTTPDVCTVDNGTVTDVGTGTCTLTATVTDSDGYAATGAGQSFTVTPAAATITASSQATTYGSDPATVTPIYTGLVNGDTAATTAPTCSTTATASSTVGDHPSSCSGADDPNYTFSYVDGVVSVGKAPLTVTASSQTVVYGNDPAPVVPEYSGLVDGDTAPATGATCTTDVTSASPVGTYPSSCTGADDPNYSISYATGVVSVGTAVLTVTASSQSTVYGSDPAEVTPTYSGLVNGDTAPATAPTCTTTATAASPVGDHPATCSGAADPNYTVQYADGTVTVTPAGLVVTASSQDTTYGDTPDPVTPTYSGLVDGDTAPATPPTCSTAVTATTPSGHYATTCSGAADPNYTITYAHGQVTVARAAQTITVTKAALPSAPIGKRFSVSATASSGLTPTFATAGASCTVIDRGDGTAQITAVAAGTCTISVRQAGDNRYTAADRVTMTTAVHKKAQVVAFTSAAPTGADAQVGAADTVTVSGGASGNPIVIAGSTPKLCSIADHGDGTATVTLLKAGTCKLTADQAANATYLAAPQAKQTFTITAPTAR